MLKDRRNRYITANVVPNKGRCTYAIKRLVADIENTGYSGIILNSDGEH